MNCSGAGPGARRARAAGSVLALASVLAGGATALLTGAASETEVRALWVTRASLTSPRSITNMIDAARAHGFNTILVQVRGRGDAYYPGGLEPRAAELAAAGAAFDPLGQIIADARPAGLRVHAWLNINLVASASELPPDRGHILYRHPDWLMVPRELAPRLAQFEPDNPAYAGAISRWTRGQAGLVEGLYASPIIPASADHVVTIAADVARRYDLDGLHLDYIRYPNDAFDYSRYAIAEFRAELAPALPEAARRAIDERAGVDLFAWPDALPDQWRQFRRARLSALVARIRAAVKSARPSVQLSAAVAPDLDDAIGTRLQDWRAWLDAGLLDAVCPMAYTQDAAVFTAQIVAAREAARREPVWAGIGAYRLTPAQTLDHIAAARRAGAAGVALFSYDSLIAPTAPADYLATIGRGAFGAAAAVGADLQLKADPRRSPR